MPFSITWMDLEIIVLSKSYRERQISYDITYMWNLKNDINEFIYWAGQKVRSGLSVILQKTPNELFSQPNTKQK